MKIQEINIIIQLFEFYGQLLNKRQQEVITQYIFNNLSFSEIAEILNITRQAVKDLLDRSIKILQSYEEKLKVLEKYNKTVELMQNESMRQNLIKIWE